MRLMPTLSVAVSCTFTVPETTELAAGAEMDSVGAVVSPPVPPAVAANTTSTQ